MHGWRPLLTESGSVLTRQMIALLMIVTSVLRMDAIMQTAQLRGVFF